MDHQKKNKYKLKASFGLLLINLVILMVCAQKNNHKPSNVWEHQISIRQPIANQKLRDLQAQIPTGFKIKGFFQPIQDPNIKNYDVLKKMFNIATKYYQSVLKVTANGVLPEQTKYPPQEGKCGVNVPSNFIDDGFDRKTIDSVVFVLMQYNLKTSYAAYSAPCILKRWPIYGYMGYNSYYLAKDFTKKFVFHENVIITIHELSHIYIFSYYYFDNKVFFTSYFSNERLAPEEVAKYIVIGGVNRKMIITRNVKAYIQSYFSCNDQSIGALLQDQGGTGSREKHFERKIFFNDFMTSSIWVSGAKLGGAIFSLMKDSGFYFSVDNTFSHKSTFGKGKGCNFAKGLEKSFTSPAQYCTPTSTPSINCDFDAVSGSVCQKSFFSNQQPVSLSIPNLICNSPDLGTTQSITRTVKWNSRCFNGVLPARQPFCLEAVCQSNGIKVTMGSISGICLLGQQQLKIGSLLIKCPANHQRFCSAVYCENWCDTEGICINGKCVAQLTQQTNNPLTNPCSLVISGCIDCKINSQGLPQCLDCGSLYVSQNRLSCKQCHQLIFGCKICGKSGEIKLSLQPMQNQAFCLKCLKVNQFPSQSKKVCLPCQKIIRGCLFCSSNQNGQTYCKNCGKKWLSLNQMACLQCSEAIKGCQKCQKSKDGQTLCMECNKQLKLDEVKKICKVECIKQCKNCRISQPSLCTQCLPNKLLKENNCVQNCQQKGYYLQLNRCLKCKQPCTSCKSSSYCTACRQGYTILNNKCIKCSPNCQFCRPNKCISCKNGFTFTSTYPYCIK